MVTAPLIGKVAQVSFDRIMGTILGGMIGFIVFSAGYNAVGVFGSALVVSIGEAVIRALLSELGFGSGSKFC